MNYFMCLGLAVQIGGRSKRLCLRRLDRQNNRQHFLKMPRDLEPSLNSRIFTLTALQNNQRLDSRNLIEPRPLKLSFGENLGCAFVELGKTKYASRFPTIDKGSWHKSLHQ